MSNSLTRLTSSPLPAYLKDSPGALALNQKAAAGISDFSGLPAVSIRGKVWHASVSGKEAKIPTIPNEYDQPSVDFVIAEARPCISKRFYGKPYDPRADDQPMPECSSWDGVVPDSTIEKPVNANCATCPKNAFGSGKEGRGKACQDYKRIAVALTDRTTGAMWQEGGKISVFRLDLPPTSLRGFRNYTKTLTEHNMPLPAVVTSMSFDANETHPVVTFDFVGVLPEDAFNRVLDRISDDDVASEMSGVGIVVPRPAEITPPKSQPSATKPEKKFSKQKQPPLAPAAQPDPTPSETPQMPDAERKQMLDSLDDMGIEELGELIKKLGIPMVEGARSAWLRGAIRDKFTAVPVPAPQRTPPPVQVANSDDELDAILGASV